MTDTQPLGECTFKQFAAAHDRGAHDHQAINGLPWVNEGNQRRVLVVTMPDTDSNMRITRTASAQGDRYKMETVKPMTHAGVTFGAQQKVEGFLATQRQTKVVGHDSLRLQHVRKILNGIYALPENRDLARAHPKQVQNPPRDRSELVSLQPNYSYDMIKRASKRGDVGELNWSTGKVAVRMPIARSPLTITREGDGYTIAITTANPSLQKRFDDWQAHFHEKYGITDPLNAKQLHEALAAMGPLYNAHTRDSVPLKLPPVKSYEMEPTKASVPVYNVHEARHALAHTQKLTWGQDARYGQCIRVRMENNATDLLLVRKDSVEGEGFNMFTADPVAPQADAALVQATNTRIQDFMHARRGRMQENGTLDAEDAMYLLNEVTSMQCNVVVRQRKVAAAIQTGEAANAR